MHVIKMCTAVINSREGYHVAKSPGDGNTKCVSYLRVPLKGFT